MIILSDTKREKARIIFFLFVLCAFAAILMALPRLSIPLLIAYVLSLIFAPAIPALMKLGVGKNVSVISIFFAAIFFTIYPFVKVVPMISNEIKNFEYYAPKVENYVKIEYRKFEELIKEKTGHVVETNYIEKGIVYLKTSTTDILLKISKSVVSFVEWIFVVPLFFFFMLKDGHRFKTLVLKVTPNSIFERFYWLSHQFNRQLGDYIFAKFVEAAIVGIVITGGLLFLKMRFAFIFGLLAAVTNVIPYLGPVLGMVPPLIFALVEYGVGTNLGAIAILFVIANAIDMAIVFPVLVSKIVNLHPIVVVVSVILGSQIFGVVGMIISIPLAAAIKLFVSEVYYEVYRPK